MNTLKHIWQQYATAGLVALALIGGLVWGINIGREMGASCAELGGQKSFLPSHGFWRIWAQR